MKNQKIIKIVMILLGAVFAFLLLIVFLFRNELQSLISLKQLNNHPLYEMTYYGDYGFDDFLLSGASSDEDIEKYVTKRLLKGLPIDLGITDAGCTAFVVRNEVGEVLFGRNFDFTYSPVLQVKTTPKNGYASISTVNLTFAGYSADHLPNGVSFDRFMTLAAPYLPFDGVNEKGLAIALLAVPQTSPPFEQGKVTLNTTTSIRLVLDKAATVAEAIDLLQQYNIYFSGEVDCHFLIADATGKSVLVEYWDDEIKIIETDESYQVASNFIAYDGLNIGEGFDEFERYDAVVNEIEANKGILTQQQAIALLARIGVTLEDGTDKLQWTVIYNLDHLDGSIFTARNYENSFDFSIANDSK